MQKVFANLGLQLALIPTIAVCHPREQNFIFFRFPKQLFMEDLCLYPAAQDFWLFHGEAVLCQL